MSDAQRLSVSVLFEIGYTCGIQDTVSTTAAATAAGIDARLSRFAASGEAGAMHELHRIMDRACGQCALRPNNNFTRMTASGAKGSVLNTFQISVAVGQQLVAGNRPGGNGRSLPCFCAADADGPRARGFVSSSYSVGLSPSEYFFHAAGGREGLVDTAVKTASTGYITRCLGKRFETLIVEYDGTVRDATGDIVQRRYGGDGFAGGKNRSGARGRPHQQRVVPRYSVARDVRLRVVERRARREASAVRRRDRG